MHFYFSKQLKSTVTKIFITSRTSKAILLKRVPMITNLKKKDSKFYTINLVFETECVVCDQPFEIIAHRNFKGLARTCPEHRGKWKNPNKVAKVRSKRKTRGTPHRDAVRKMLEAYSLLDDRALVDTVVAEAVKLLPRNPGERDTRRQSVRRAIRTMAEKDLLGCTLSGDYFIF